MILTKKTSTIFFLKRIFVFLTIPCIFRCSGYPVFIEVTEPPTVDRYLLSPGDEIEVKFYYNPELSDRVTIRPDGRISLLLVDSIVAEGITPEELDEILTELYLQKLDRVDLTVIVRTYSSQNVFIDGEVNTPQPLPLIGKLTALEALVAAGGTKKTADLGSVLLIRPESEGEDRIISVQKLNLTTSKKGVQNNVYLQPNDILYVPNTRIARINQFVEQYLSNMIPDWIRVTVPFVYSLGGEPVGGKIIVTE